MRVSLAVLESGLTCTSDKPDGPAFPASRLSGFKSRKAGSFRKLEIEAGKAGKLKGKFRKRENEAGKAGKLKRKG